MTIDYHSGKFLLISFKVSLHEFILGFSHCVCGRRCAPMFHTEDRAAGKDKSLTFSRGCHVIERIYHHSKVKPPVKNMGRYDFHGNKWGMAFFLF